MSIARRKVGEKPKPKDESPLTEAVAAVHGDARAFVTMVGRFVSYRDFFKLEDGVLSVGAFRDLVGAAIFDLFGSDLGDEQKASKLGMDTAKLESLRQHPTFPGVSEKLMEAATDLALPRTYEQWAEKAEDLLARDGMRLAMLSPDAKVRQAANQEFIARRSAKKGRPGEQKVLVIPDKLFREIEAGMKALGPAQKVDSEIDASVLNVPRMIGSGSTE